MSIRIETSAERANGRKGGPGFRSGLGAAGRCAQWLAARAGEGIGFAWRCKSWWLVSTLVVMLMVTLALLVWDFELPCIYVPGG